MNHESRSACDNLGEMTETPVSRRAAVGSSGLALLGLLAGSTFARSREEALKQAQERARERSQAAADARSREVQENMDPQERAFFEQIRDAGSAEERTRVVLDYQLRQMLQRLRKEQGQRAL